MKNISIQGLQSNLSLVVKDQNLSKVNNSSKFDENMFQDSNINQQDFDEGFVFQNEEAGHVVNNTLQPACNDELGISNVFNASSPLSEAMMNPQNNVSSLHPSNFQAEVSMNRNSQDNEMYDLCFVVENCEFLAIKQGFLRHS